MDTLQLYSRAGFFIQSIFCTNILEVTWNKRNYAYLKLWRFNASKLYTKSVCELFLFIITNRETNKKQSYTKLLHIYTSELNVGKNIMHAIPDEVFLTTRVIFNVILKTEIKINSLLWVLKLKYENKILKYILIIDKGDW